MGDVLYVTRASFNVFCMARMCKNGMGNKGRNELILMRIPNSSLRCVVEKTTLKRYELCHKMGFKKSYETFLGETFHGQTKTIHLKHRGLQESNLIGIHFLTLHALNHVMRIEMFSKKKSNETRNKQVSGTP